MHTQPPFVICSFICPVPISPRLTRSTSRFSPAAKSEYLRRRVALEAGESECVCVCVRRSSASRRFSPTVVSVCEPRWVGNCVLDGVCCCTLRRGLLAARAAPSPSSGAISALGFLHSRVCDNFKDRRLCCPDREENRSRPLHVTSGSLLDGCSALRLDGRIAHFMKVDVNF